MTNSCRT